MKKPSSPTREATVKSAKKPPESHAKNHEQTTPKPPLSQSKSRVKTTDGSSLIDSEKLSDLKGRIQREQALRNAEKAQDQKKESAILSQASSPQPTSETFVCSPIMLDVSAGVTFHIMRKIVNMFQKDLMPLSESQKEQVKGLLAYYAETYLPAALAKYQRAGDAIFVIGGILMMNTTDLRPAKEDKKPDEPHVTTEAASVVISPEPYQSGTPTIPVPPPVPRPEAQE